MAFVRLVTVAFDRRLAHPNISAWRPLASYSCELARLNPACKKVSLCYLVIFARAYKYLATCGA